MYCFICTFSFIQREIFLKIIYVSKCWTTQENHLYYVHWITVKIHNKLSHIKPLKSSSSPGIVHSPFLSRFFLWKWLGNKIRFKNKFPILSQDISICSIFDISIENIIQKCQLYVHTWLYYKYRVQKRLYRNTVLFSFNVLHSMSNFKFGPDLQGNSPAVIIPVKKFFEKETF